jgi:outer membrane immunogenic protein
MNRLSILGVALLAGTTAASAADLGRRPLKAPPVAAPVAVWNWTGFYVGAHAGYGFGDNDSVDTSGQAAINITNVLGGARPATVGLERDGFVGGGQMGYNWQFAPNWLIGIEADISYTDFRESTDVRTVPLAGVGSLLNTFSTRLDYLGTVRGRIGYVVDRTLFYATGGLAYGDVRNTVNFFGPAGQLQFSGRNSSVETGYAVGGGIEHAFLPNWTVKGEYIYFDLGRDTVNVAVIPGSGGGGTGYNSTFRNDGHIGRVGLNYKFGPM